MAATSKPSGDKPRKPRVAASKGADRPAAGEEPVASPLNPPPPAGPAPAPDPTSTERHGGMDRETFSRVFYGDGDVPPPWATDCPVKFEVWLEYANNPEADLILALGEQHVVAEVFRHIQTFPPVAPPDVGHRRPVLAGGYIAVKLTFAELIAMVLPLTSLGRKIGSARSVVAAFGGDPVTVFAMMIRGDDFVVPDNEGTIPTPLEQAQIGYRNVERREHLRWFVRILDAVTASQLASGSTDAQRRQIIWSLLQSVPVTQQWLPSVNQTRPTIDRRARHPVRAVTLNRRLTLAVSESRVTIKADAAEQLFGVDCSEIGWAVVDSGIDATHPAFALRPPAALPPGLQSCDALPDCSDQSRRRTHVACDRFAGLWHRCCRLSR